MKRKATQPRLLPRTVFEPLKEADALTLSDLTTCYRCRCENSTEIGIRLEAMTCVECGSPMEVQL